MEDSVSLEFKPASKPLFIERIDHLGIAARSGDSARSVYVDGLGWPLESTQTDSEFLVPIGITSNDRYGAKSHAGTSVPRVGSGQIALFVTVGDFDLEIMQPLSEQTASGRSFRMRSRNPQLPPFSRHNRYINRFTNLEAMRDIPSKFFEKIDT